MIRSRASFAVAVAAALATLALAALAFASRAEAYVYWTNVDTDSIGRANLDGTGVNPNFITGTSGAYAVAVDALEPAPTIDATAELILNGPTRSAATKKGFVVRVTNLGMGPITIDPATDTSAVVTVNGSPAGSVELKSTNSKTLGPGARTRFRYQWNLEGSLLPGDTVVYSGTVSLADDADPGNNTDSATATAR